MRVYLQTEKRAIEARTLKLYRDLTISFLFDFFSLLTITLKMLKNFMNRSEQKTCACLSSNTKTCH